ncbi:MAG: tetratricopeptide repeat protein [Candidatus Nitrohelix vancouverensis]|uniref:Tetratricopeptide repeat protein n=1 Tax=Candidatus Nitrohelix vancouverensis TaxID=2705534 RepID=A0A7T0C4Z6_9BACT|nr:MAG: tetratricopeptide repeat protein [Candidatus Nitrohelix vancouverensis]
MIRTVTAYCFSPLLVVYFLLFLLVSVPHASDEIDIRQADALNHQVMELYRAGSYSKAVPLAVNALEMRKEILGPTHPNVAVSMNNLALLYVSLGRYQQAERLYLKALKIFQMHLSMEHEHVSATLKNLEALYKALDEGEKERDSKTVLMV